LLKTLGKGCFAVRQRCTAMRNAFAVHRIFAVRCIGPLPCTFLCRAASSVVAVNRIFAVRSCLSFPWPRSLPCVFICAHGKESLHGDAYFPVVWRGDGARVDSSSRYRLWSLVAFDEYAGSEVADPIGWIWRRVVFFLDFMELRRSESEVRWRRETRISVNKAVSRGCSLC
jgi:hypothetical protein